MTKPIMHGPTLLTEEDIYLFKEGSHFKLYEKLGSHPTRVEGQDGVLFSVWAPNAKEVSVIGEFNDWTAGRHPLAVRWDGSGIWEGFVPGLKSGVAYKIHLRSAVRDFQVDKADPFALRCQVPPETASIVHEPAYRWGDEEWMRRRGQTDPLRAPMAIYEMHLGSFRRNVEAHNRSLSYREITPFLVAHLEEAGFTHVEFLPLMEHPFYGSWGYQSTGYFAPTSRYGLPEDLMYLIDQLHQHGFGVILDWVPSHFPADEHGLAYFDGTHLFEHEDPRQGFHPDWKSSIFNYGRNEVRNFLISSALFWLDRFHVDGLRVDAVASMLYLDYSRKDQEWVPNRYGGRENLEAISFLRRFNEAVTQFHPDVVTIAEESTSWPMVSRPAYAGGLGFGLKWKMGWMHDTLEYLRQDPLFRRYHHDKLTFSMWYAFAENFLLPLSHDEVVFGKGSLAGKMPGDDWQKMANLRLLLGYQYAHPGKKLLFMGSEWGQWSEWNHEASLDWHLLEGGLHRGVLHWVRDLNRVYRQEPALFAADFDPAGFAWVDFKDSEKSVLAFMRLNPADGHFVVVACNFTPLPRHNYRLGVPRGGFYRELLNSDGTWYGGSGQGNLGGVEATPVPFHGHYQSISLTLPPLGFLMLKPVEE